MINKRVKTGVRINIDSSIDITIFSYEDPRSISRNSFETNCRDDN